MYIADTENSRIRKVDTNGIISTFAGDNTLPISASIITIDNIGNLYLGTLRIRKMDSNGSFSLVGGNGTRGYSGDGGQATNAQFRTLVSMCTDTDNNIYILDKSSNRVRKIDKNTGIITTIVGNGLSGYSGDGLQATNAKLNYPLDISFDPIGNLYIADTSNHRIRKIDKNTGLISTVAGNGTPGYSGDGNTATNANLYNPNRIAFDFEGNMYITDSGNYRVRKIDKNTNIITTIAGNGINLTSGDGGFATNASLKYIDRIALDKFGNIYLATDFRIRKIEKNTGNIFNIAGTGGTISSGDNGPAIEAGVDASGGIVFDSNGNIYIAGGGKVRKITSTPTVQP